MGLTKYKKALEDTRLWTLGSSEMFTVMRGMGSSIGNKAGVTSRVMDSEEENVWGW